jgi:hypothetical protein
MKKDLLKILTGAAVLVAVMVSCTKKLDLTPTNGITVDSVYSTPAGYKQALAKVYASFALTGNQGGTGKPDVSPQIISDEGNSDFLRLYWNLQELTTDEAAWTWQNDAGIQGLHEMSWSSINPIVDGLYYRSFFQITLANDFIRNSSDDALTAKGFSSADVANIKKYRAEARFLRAYQYWVLMDVYANPPFVDEKAPIATSVPKQIKRADLFTWLETELKGMDADLADARTNEYGRADKAAEWSLLARLYLNAQVYTGTARNTDAITYANKVIGAGYTLHSDYTQLMLADNNLNTDEFIFAINYDGKNTQNWGGTTYLCHGPAHVPAAKSGTSGDWGGLRCTQDFVTKFSDYSGTTDKRPQFYTSGQNLAMNDLYTGTDGFSTFKFRNLTRSGGAAPDLDPQKNWVDVDFPIFRLAESYLVYAEAVLRGGTGGDAATALNYINKIRTRAYGDASGNIASGQLTLDFVLDERARELYYEAQRRTDLIRYGKFTTSSYLWAWKGGVKTGTSVQDKYNIFPLPTTDLTANPNLIQNVGY